MEESEKRRERLKAMRLEADQAIVSCNAGNSLGESPGLANPLIESSACQSAQSDSHVARRFDYYTDPMSAFSANKRRNKVSHQVSQDYNTPPRPRNDMTPPPAHGAYTYSRDQRSFEAQGVYHGSHLGSPVQKPVPFGTPQVNSPGIFSGSNTYSTDQRMFRAQGTYHSSSPRGSPMQMASPFGSPQMNSPGVFGGSTGTSSSFVPSNLSRGGSYPIHGIAQRGGSHSFGRGRGQMFNNSPGRVSVRGFSSPYPNTGRGRSDWLGGNSISPSSRQSGRGRLGSHNSRGRLGSHNTVSAEVRPSSFYHRSMVEDPWEHLKPVIWKKPVSSKSWLPESIQMKKARVAQDSNKCTGEPSLAEYLAASFSEAVDDATNDI